MIILASSDSQLQMHLGYGYNPIPTVLFPRT